MAIGVAPELTAMSLLYEYLPSSSFFASPERTLLADGDREWLPAASAIPDAGLAGRVDQLLADQTPAVSAGAKFSNHSAPTPLVIGALPFDSARPACLSLVRTPRWAGPLHPQAASLEHRSAIRNGQLQELPEPQIHEENVAKAVVALQAGELRKVVLSRSLELLSAEPVDVAQLLRNVARRNSQGYTFAVNLPALETGIESESAGQVRRHSNRVLIGASPELLVSKYGSRVAANPLAGSLPRSDDPEEDQRRIRELYASVKDREEHQVVIDALVDGLRPFCRRLNVPAKPSLISTPTVWHLSTMITGEIIDPSVSALTLATALHPTPAICGTPTAEAQAFIKRSEPFDRGFYTGAVGWTDARGDGEWGITIRCADVQGDSLRLFAGGGIMPASEPALELAETSAKFQTMLQAIGW